MSRPLPQTKAEWEKFKEYFLDAYQDVDDMPETWTFILSQLQGVKMPELDFDPYEIYRHFKRWKIAKVLQDEKIVYLAQLQDKLKEKIEALQKAEAEKNGEPSLSEHSEHVSSESPDIQGDVPPLSGVEEALVPSPKW